LFIDLVDIDKLELYNKAEVDKELIDKEAKKAKFRLLGPFSKAYNIIVYIHSLDSCTDYFKNLAGRMILIDNHTR
jgi:hypothetical protein